MNIDKKIESLIKEAPVSIKEAKMSETGTMGMEIKAGLTDDFKPMLKHLIYEVVKESVGEGTEPQGSGYSWGIIDKRVQTLQKARELLKLEEEE